MDTKDMKMDTNEPCTTANTIKADENGSPNVCVVKITRTKALFVMLYFNGDHGGNEMLTAANFKKSRLDKLYPQAEIRVEGYTTVASFKAIWTKIDQDVNKKTKGGVAVYDLCEMHIFGHSNHRQLHLVGKGENITIPMVNDLEKLKWNKDRGAIVMHACRSARYEDNPLAAADTENGSVIPESQVNKNCIALEFSIQQQTKVIGQMMFATFNTGDSFDDWKYRNDGISNKVSVDYLMFENLVLWGYKSGGKVDHYKTDKEYAQLDDYQIWPSREFNCGVETERAVNKFSFNYTDMRYI